MGKEVFETFMIIFGFKTKIPSDDHVKWAISIAYKCLIIIVNMKLVISVIGETYAKQ